jgi:putative oxidoreductase
MAMASVTAHKGKPIWVTSGGAELPVVNMAAALALILSGPDKYSLDRMLGIRLPGWITPLGLLVILLTVLYARAGGDEPPEESQDAAREETAGNPDAE